MHKKDGHQPAILSKVGLGEGSALPVGVPVPWPTATAPGGWLKCNGAAFTASQYPKLALVYPTLVLPDLRGEFLRGWDDGRGVDSGRKLLSTQAGSVIRQSAGPTSSSSTNPANVWDNESFDSITSQTLWGSINATVQVAGGRVGTVRPRNIAFNYIVRAE
ncbi:phage tail protein [Klebsiella pneumoniae]|uniref:phage tail protein n=1 Tax=Klebsiella pneumoniae TaxID=573 RepID=UPI0028774E85|nr:phage tail protein [Klebsiella pneumoniae]